MTAATLDAGAAPGLVPGALSPLDTLGAVIDLQQYANRPQSRFGFGWSIDTTCGQIGTGEMGIILARTGAGKSTCILNIIRNTPDVPTLVVNMEMTARKQVEWLTAMTYSLTTPARDIEDVLRSGPDDDRYGEVKAALDGMPDHYPNLHFVTPSRPTISDIGYVLDDIEDMTGQRPVRIFIDHLGLMHGCTDYSGYVNMTSGLHSFAMREDLAIVVLQQVGRNAGDGQKNNGHLPLTLESGKYGGEEDADWVYGIYRPDRNPKFKKSRYAFEDPEDYYEMLNEYQRVRGITIFQVLKNRPLNEVLEQGLELRFNPHDKTYTEIGVHNDE